MYINKAKNIADLYTKISQKRRSLNRSRISKDFSSLNPYNALQYESRKDSQEESSSKTYD